jgi:hypothetical protein
MGKERDFVFLESSGDVVHVALTDTFEDGTGPRRTLCLRTLKKWRAFIHFTRRDTPKYFCEKCYSLLRHAVNEANIRPTGRLL